MERDITLKNFIKRKEILTMKKSITKRLVSFLCVVVTLLSMTSIFAVGASAASVRQKFDCDRTVTFTVKTTSKSPSIKFVCDAAKVTQKRQTHQCSRAPLMAISVSPAIDGESFFLIKGTGKNITSTLRLKKNTTYTIKVSYYVTDVNRCKCKFGDLMYCNFHDMGVGGMKTRYRGYKSVNDDYTNGFWYISRTSNCTISNIRVK